MTKATNQAMSPRKGSQLETVKLATMLHAAGCVAALALSAAWIASEWLQVSSPLGRTAILAAALVVAGLSAVLTGRLVIKGRRRAIRAVKLLCQTNYLELSEDRPLEDLFDRQLDPVLRASLLQLGSQLRGQAERLQEAEQARGKAEAKAKRLAGEHRLLKQILDGLHDPVVVVDRFHDLSYLNDSAAALLGIASDSPESRPLECLSGCEPLVTLLVETSQHQAQTVRSTDVRFDGDENEANWFRIRCRSLASDETEASAAAGSGAVAVLRDINEQKTMQRRNAEFVSAVSHEMKTPLTGIKAYVELLADGDAEDEQTREEFLGVINSQADRLQRLIDNLLDLARIEAGVVEVDKRQISLNELLERALEVVAPAAERKSIELAGELSPMYLGVLADHDMMLQAAINLLSNAIKYTPDGGRVTLRSQMLGSDIAFEVEDTGVGLAPDDCRRVFDKFYRVKKDKQMAPGTGLGLPLAKHIVEDVHGGRLDVESEIGVGSTFRITLTEQTQVPALV